MSTPPPSGPSGGSNVANVAKKLGTPPSIDGTLIAEHLEPHVVVHMYLVPPGNGVQARRSNFRGEIETELGTLHSIRMHETAWLVPCFTSSGRQIAEQTFLALVRAGQPTLPPPVNPAAAAHPHEWKKGDVVYVHYLDDNDLLVTVASPVPSDGSPLPIPQL